MVDVTADPAMDDAEHGSTRRPRRGFRALVVVGVVGVLYLMMTFLNPRIVPRLSVLPAPASRGEWYDTCNGAPMNKHSETWSRGVPFWTSTEFQTLVGCVDQSPGHS